MGRAGKTVRHPELAEGSVLRILKSVTPNQTKFFWLIIAACLLTWVGIFSFSLGIRPPYNFIFPIAVIILTLFAGRYLKPRK
jgi:hypothetical protein